MESKAAEIEESQKDAVPPIPLTLILNVGREFTQLNLQELVLRARGYVVESALSPESAIKCFRQGDFDLILLCHSISPRDRDSFIAAIRAYGSRVPIVCLPSDSNYMFPPDQLGTARRVLDIISRVMKNAPRHSAMGATVYPQSCECYRPKTSPTPKAVLCIHDNQEFLNIERRLLGDAGYLVLTTRNCVDCLNIFSTGVADAVVLSYWMPARNGGVLATQMRQKTKDIPLILISGSSTVPDVERPLFDHILPKSCSPQVLPALLGELFRGAFHAPVVGR
jgi:CheY-like chemotaxis protein